MTTWQHAFNFAFQNGIPDAFGYAEYYVSNYPEGDYSHSVVIPDFLALSD